MIRIAIVEDENIMSDNLKECINKFFKENNEKCTIDCFSSAEEFLGFFKKNYHVIFMDINLSNEIDGIEAAKKVRRLDSSVLIIFVTSLAQYAIKGYEVNAFDFILKPINYYTFNLKLKNVLLSLNNKLNRTIVISSKGAVRKINVNELKYIEISDHKLIFHLEDGEDYIAYGTLKTYLKMSEFDSFALCNQCYFVNLKFVKEVRQNNVIVGKTSLLISRPKRKEFIQKLNEYFSEGGE